MSTGSSQAESALAALAAGEDDADEILVGTVIDGRYRIDSVLGAGGMGRVYRGEHTGIGRPVAIKVLHTTMHRNREASQRFQREALASGRLEHANIVNVSDFGTLPTGACFLVMEALEGESLGQRLEREGRLPWREAVAIIRDVMVGLRHAHDRGVVHRDIKPDNVFLAIKDGVPVVKILDFGIAKLYAGHPDDPASTGIGLTIGTPAYLSPEQASGGEITPSSDLYSTSAVLFELLTGRAVFEMPDALGMLGAHVTQPPPLVRDVAPELDIPPALDELLQHGLAKRPADRVASAEAYLARLEPFLEVPTPPARALTPLPVEPEALGVMETAMQLHVTPPPFAAVGAVSTVSLPALPPPSSQSSPSSFPALVSRQRWPLVIGFLVVTLILVIATRHRATPPAMLATAPATKPSEVTSAPATAGRAAKPRPTRTPPAAPKPTPAATAPVVTPPAAPVTPVDDPPPEPAPAPAIELPTQPKAREAAFQAALKTLTTAKTCPARKAAIPTLVAFDDPRAIQPLEKARRRMRGGVLGIGQSNTNACLTDAATAAVATLKHVD